MSLFSQGAYSAKFTRFQSQFSLKDYKIPLQSNLHILSADADRGHHCSPLSHVSNLIPELRGVVQKEITKRK